MRTGIYMLQNKWFRWIVSFLLGGLLYWIIWLFASGTFYSTLYFFLMYLGYILEGFSRGSLYASGGMFFSLFTGFFVQAQIMFILGYTNGFFKLFALFLAPILPFIMAYIILRVWKNNPFSKRAVFIGMLIPLIIIIFSTISVLNSHVIREEHSLTPSLNEPCSMAWNKNSCFADLALQEKDPNLCENVMTGNFDKTRKTCRDRIYAAAITESIEGCTQIKKDKIIPYMWTDECFDYAAVTNNDVSICERIESTWNRAECIGNIATDPSACESLNDTSNGYNFNRMAHCWVVMTEKLNDTSLCQKITDPTYQASRCHKGEAKKENYSVDVEVITYHPQVTTD
jgi:hypothetical protein